jgi:hypothetical protein
LYNNISIDYLEVLQMSSIDLRLPANDSSQARLVFTQLGFEYYLSARFCLLSRLHHIAGNVFHSAIEMFLKGELVRVIELEKLKKIGHDLKKLWRHFVINNRTDIDLQSDTASIEQIDLFERIRYPDNLISEGMELQVTIHPGDHIESDGVIQLPTYRLSLALMDRLIIRIIDASTLNPPFFLSMIPEESTVFLRRNNEYAQRWSITTG